MTLYGDNKTDWMGFYGQWQVPDVSGSGPRLQCGFWQVKNMGVPVHMVIVGSACSGVRAANPVPQPTGTRPFAGARHRAPLLPLHLLRFSYGSKGGAGGEQVCVLVFSSHVGSTCSPESWSSWCAHRPRGIASRTHYHNYWLIVFLSINCHAKGVMYLHEPNLAPRTLMQNHRVSPVVLMTFSLQISM